MKPLKALPLANLQKRRSAKWREFPSDVLPLPVMEMDFEIAKRIRKTLLEMTKASDTGYLGPMPELPQALAEFALNRWNWKIDTEQVFLAPDVGVGNIEMARMIVNPGDHIVVDTPVYHNFANWIKELKCHIVDAPMKKDGLHYTLNLPLIEQAYKNGAKIHLLCNPQNPTGTVHTKEELSDLAELAKQYGVAIFSDEIHAPLTYDASTFTPFLTVSETAREVGIAVTSASKSWNIAGLKCAQVVTAHPRWQEIAKAMPPAVHWRTSLFGAAATVEAYQSVDWLDACLARLDKNRELVGALIAEHLPTVGYRVPDTSYVAWLDLTSLNLGENPAATLLERGRLACNPGVSFSSTHTQFVRFNFGTSKANITEAILRIKKSIS